MNILIFKKIERVVNQTPTKSVILLKLSESNFRVYARGSFEDFEQFLSGYVDSQGQVIRY